jgi:hypothetical protein
MPELHVTASFTNRARTLAQEWLSYRSDSAPLAILVPDESESFLARLRVESKWPPLSKLKFEEIAAFIIYLDDFTHSKGLEFCLRHNIDPSSTTGQEIAEPWRRHLRLYVTMTRAKEQLYAVAAPQSFLAGAMKEHSESLVLVDREA